MKKPWLLVLICCVLMTACNLSPDYEVAVNPPPGDAQAADIFPESIGENLPKVDKPPYGGIAAMYGDKQSIYIARLSSTDEAIAFFKENLIEEFKSQSSNFSGTVNGQFYAKANGKSKQLFGWVNGNYAFVIKAGDKQGLDQIVSSFDYITMK